ncbi:MAG: hypothetical protein JNK82_34135 [Myxococcaceae bacterium]|nr:hypothetical protein [Myxococcaceae bacterium]
MWFTDLFKRESSDAARRERLEEIERQLTQSLRTIGTAFTSLANMIEQRRLQRAGYEKQERFLQRTDSNYDTQAVEKK